jgi:hypothetical protein
LNNELRIDHKFAVMATGVNVEGGDASCAGLADSLVADSFAFLSASSAIASSNYRKDIAN